MEFKDYYKILGVSRTASAPEIKKAFRQLARKYHPDVNPGDQSAETKFKELNEANEIIGDTNTRQKYDQLGLNSRQHENIPSGWSRPFGVDPQSGVKWNINLGGSPGGRTMSEHEVREMFGQNPFSDFFPTFSAGGSQTAGRESKPRKRHGRDVEHTIELELEQAYYGVTQRLSIRPANENRVRHVEVRIPAGVTDGSRVRVTGQGETGLDGGGTGDLYLRVHLKPHQVFVCKSHHLYVTTTVPRMTTVLGGEVDVQTLDGASVRLKIPPATKHGQVFRLKNKGLPGLGRRTTRGDLYATVHVMEDSTRSTAPVH
jgi:DnaJ-class molecular chaperone